MIRLLIAIALAACSSPVEPHTPFMIPAWTTMPSDDDIVVAILGRGGTEQQRIDAAAAARDLVLPRLRESGTVSQLRWNLQLLQDSYKFNREQALGQPLLRTLVLDEVGSIGQRAACLATTRLHATLWPTEPKPEEWECAAIAPARVPDAAAALERRLTEIEERYRSRFPVVFARIPIEISNREFGHHRIVAIARNDVYVAKTGDTSVTNGQIHDVLARRGIATRRLPEDRPY